MSVLKSNLIPVSEVNRMGILTGYPYIPYGIASVLPLTEAREFRRLKVHGCFREAGIRKSWKVVVSYTTMHGDSIIKKHFDLYQDPDGKLFAKLSNVRIPVAATAVYVE